jgi:tRNA-splicing ligase RtcB (3'-phosphate/5'-hydroxy nucleic acid ligase)
VELTFVGADTAERALRRASVFDSAAAPADPAVLQRLHDGVAEVDLAAPPVVLPDFHHKHDLEMPSSIAVATQGTIRPAFTSASVNCGMALMALDMDRPTDEAVAAFYAGVRHRYPHPPSWRRELSTGDVLRAAEEGAAFGVDRYGLESDALDRVEEGGRLDLEPYGGAQRLRRELPALSFQASRFRFGSIGPSNHFVELQVVEEVLDEHAAAVLGVAAGQLTLQFHAGGGLLTGQVGRLFARRKKINPQLRMQMAIARPLAHLATARSRAQLVQRLSYYFRNGCPAIPLDGPEGARVMLANAAAMNYGFAFRAATYGTLSALARTSLGARDVRLVVDSPHNSIYEEDVAGSPALVHRHNSCRAYPADRMPAGTPFGEVGQAVLVPGTNRTSSYLCVASAGAHRSLYSACHGAGTVIDAFAASGASVSDPEGRSTLRFRYGDDEPQRVAHLDDRGVDEALAILTRSDLVRPVARMRPIAVLN